MSDYKQRPSLFGLTRPRIYFDLDYWRVTEMPHDTMPMLEYNEMLKLWVKAHNFIIFLNTQRHG